MQELVIVGKNKLQGKIAIQGCKNSVLPLLSAALLTEGTVRLFHCPRLTDVDNALDILRYLGCYADWIERNTVSITAGKHCADDIPADFMQRMRSSVLFLGAVLGKCGKATLCFPGGCKLGPRPIDLHLSALRAMGAEIVQEGSCLFCSAPQGLHGAIIRLSFPSVGATENSILAACNAQGDTVIENAAKEPEIVDLVRFLRACGAEIYGEGSYRILIHGKVALKATDYTVISDRIAAATYLAATAATGGHTEIKGISPLLLAKVLDCMEASGCSISRRKESISLRSSGKLRAIAPVITAPYPLFPTDAQAPLMAMLAKSEGTTQFCENMFSQRYHHAEELCRMGAKITVNGACAQVEGVSSLFGASVAAKDLRGAAALTVAALAAEGTTHLTGLEHFDRGYESAEHLLAQCGANIIRK